MIKPLKNWGEDYKPSDIDPQIWRDQVFAEKINEVIEAVNRLEEYTDLLLEMLKKQVDINDGLEDVKHGRVSKTFDTSPGTSTDYTPKGEEFH